MLDVAHPPAFDMPLVGLCAFWGYDIGQSLNSGRCLTCLLIANIFCIHCPDNCAATSRVKNRGVPSSHGPPINIRHRRSCLGRPGAESTACGRGVRHGCGWRGVSGGRWRRFDFRSARVKRVGGTAADCESAEEVRVTAGRRWPSSASRRTAAVKIGRLEAPW